MLSVPDQGAKPAFKLFSDLPQKIPSPEMTTSSVQGRSTALLKSSDYANLARTHFFCGLYQGSFSSDCRASSSSSTEDIMVIIATVCIHLRVQYKCHVITAAETALKLI